MAILNLNNPWHPILMMFYLILLASILFLATVQSEPLPSTQEIFHQHKNRIVQIKILESSTDIKASLGTGFYVSNNGDIITNYHVISKIIHDPSHYSAVIKNHQGDTFPLEILQIDVIHDLAIVKANISSSEFFDFADLTLDKGYRIYSLGNPHDLGSTIVEGTYNGIVEESLYEKIHYTGSINPGMSGGPAINHQGKVVGINVSTAGNQISFLIPAKFAKNLFENKNHEPQSINLLSSIKKQLLDYQDNYMQKLLSASFTTTKIGHYRAPGKIANFLKCWSDSSRKQENLYEVVYSGCSTNDSIYISNQHSTGTINFEHMLISSKHLNKFRFYQLYQDFFQTSYSGIQASQEDVTNYQCHTEFVQTNKLPFRVALCLRPYKKFPELYDAILRVASLNKNNMGIQSTLVLSGVNFENAKQFSKKYLESFSWKTP